MNLQNIKFLFNNKIGLVLSGGGAKGAYHIGVFKALKELGISQLVKVVSGTSIGALNGVLFLQDDEKIWLDTWKDASFKNFLSLRESKNSGKKNLTDLSDILKTPIQKLKSNWKDSSDIGEFILKQNINLFSQDGLKKVLNKHIDLSKVNDSAIDAYACAYNIDRYQPEYFNLKRLSHEDQLKALLASSCIPFLYEPVVINDQKYMDGGIYIPLYKTDNVVNIPVKPAFDARCDIVIIVYLNHKDKVDYTTFQKELKNTVVLEIYPSQPLEEIKGTGIFDFSRNNLEDRIELGYHNAMFVIAPLMVKMFQGKKMDELIKNQNSYNDHLRGKFYKSKS